MSLLDGNCAFATALVMNRLLPDSLLIENAYMTGLLINITDNALEALARIA